jgi:hypothetical protein
MGTKNAAILRLHTAISFRRCKHTNIILIMQEKQTFLHVNKRYVLIYLHL